VKNEKCFAPLRLKAFERQYYLKTLPSGRWRGPLPKKNKAGIVFLCAFFLDESENLVNFASK
jgi:hypothetical protein